MAKLLTHGISHGESLPPELRSGAVAIGNFDGVHRGHAVLIGQLVAAAKRVGGPATVLTFDPPPATVLHPTKAPTIPLTTLQRRAELLGQLGVQNVVALKTTPELLQLSADAFFQKTIVQELSAAAMVEGPNFHFGHNREGDTQRLRALCTAANIELSIVEAKLDAGQLISSTRIRQAISMGNMAEANLMLTQSYEIRGTVSPGAQRGRELGFPTANLEGIQVSLPAHGVYAGRVQIGDRRQPAAINIGPNPTFGDSANKVEIHVIDWQGDLYGQSLTCSIETRIRAVRQFGSIDELKSQIQHDVRSCLDALAK